MSLSVTSIVSAVRQTAPGRDPARCIAHHRPTPEWPK